ncbi:thioredoxin-dependent thiol peroxidase [Swingsia samuiensis]|uniref:thioredoxin-dependent peroxiredoxin n=1 Tax=Swingsia samuiensis TaxID=1293412 RepID=A0A4Y6UI40_9PROT|nr:thioredoxin-dependent thiol peroxidase [Swingsia samuiensis]QDH17269.1 thioredoxin-dependent thiol peroxidase [Swingsia samuiensis]
MTASDIKPGDLAPEFSLPLASGGNISSKALKGKPYLLYFYPKADTPGCTTQACSLQEHLPSFKDLDLTVIGVSPDPVEKIVKFVQKYDLEFPLGSDVDHKVAEAYGTWVEKSMYGRTYMGMERSSFLVDKEGIVRAVWRKVKPAQHVDLVLEAWNKIKA